MDGSTGSVWSAPDDSFTKTVVSSGSGLEKPNEGSNCCIKIESFVGGHRDEAIFGCPVGAEARIVLGNGLGGLSRLVDAVVESMRKGETSTVKVSSEVAPAKTPPRRESEAEFSFNLTLVEFQRTKEVHELTLKEKVERIRNYKTFGSECFKNDKLELAESFYIRGLQYAIISEQFLEEDEFPEVIEKLWDLKKLCLLNLSACQLKTDRYMDVVSNCTSAIEIDNISVKGYFRRGLARMNLQDYELAMEDFSRGLELAPNNKQLSDQMKLLKAKMQTVDDKYAMSMKKLFD